MLWFILTGLALVFLVGCVFAFLLDDGSDDAKFGSIGVAILTVLAWAGVTLLLCASTVENGHIGIVKQFGSLVGTTGEGLVWTAPWQTVDEVSVQNEIRTYNMTDDGEGIGSAVSSDSQPVYMTVVVDYSLERSHAVSLYRLTGGHFVERKLDPAVPQLSKEVTAQYKAIDFASNREVIRRQIQESLQHELEPLGIRINTISLKNVDFTDALKKAIEAKVEAEQQAKAAEAKVKIKEAEARQQIAEAQGEATSNVTRARGEATANRLRQRSLTPLLVQQQAIEKLNPNVKIIVCPPRTVCVPNSGFNVGD